jgi:hypothetical protein
MYAPARCQRLGEFPSVRLLSFCLCLRTPVTPKYPSGKWYGSHFWLHATPSLCHARSVDCRILALVNCNCPESAREAMSTYRLFSVLSKGLNFFVFYFVIGKIRIGVMKMKWWLKDFDDMYSWEFSVWYRKRKSVLSKAMLSFNAIKIFADVHWAVFASARSNQHLES